MGQAPTSREISRETVRLLPSNLARNLWSIHCPSFAVIRGLRGVRTRGGGKALVCTKNTFVFLCRQRTQTAHRFRRQCARVPVHMKVNPVRFSVHKCRPHVRENQPNLERNRKRRVLFENDPSSHYWPSHPPYSLKRGRL